jgi:hypothetical protein
MHSTLATYNCRTQADNCSVMPESALESVLIAEQCPMLESIHCQTAKNPKNANKRSLVHTYFFLRLRKL